MKDFANRKNILTERIAAQRVELAELAGDLERSLWMFDKGYAFAQKLQRQPRWLIGVTFLSAVIFRKRLYALLKKAPLLAAVQWWLSWRRQS